MTIYVQHSFRLNLPGFHVKIAPKDVDSFIASYPSGRKETPPFVLCYGPDAGRAALTAKSLEMRFAAAYPAAEIFKGDAGALKDDPSLLEESLRSQSLFAVGPKLVIWRECGAALPKGSEDVLEACAGGVRVIFVAGDLAATSSLRKAAESSPKFAVLACYKDDADSLSTFARAFFAEHGIKPEAQAMHYLARKLPGDRMIMLRELEKIVIYLGGPANLTEADVRQICDAESETRLDRLCSAVFEGIPARATEEAAALAADDMPAVAQARVLQKHARRLIQMKLLSADPEEAVKLSKPPVFFKEVPSFVRQLRNWSIHGLRRAELALTECEIGLKSSASDPDILWRYTVLRLAAAAKRGT